MIPEKRLKNGFSIPAFGMGSWSFGGRQTHAEGNDDARQLIALENGFKAGVRLIDTAEYYADGYAETLIGKVLAHQNRNRIFLSGKVWKTHLRRDDVFRSVERSLQRLGTDYFDCLMIHQVNDDVPLEETLGAFLELQEQRLIRAIGVSNFALSRLKRALKIAPVMLNQVHYNLQIREPETSGLLQFCQENEVILQAWRPLRDLESSALTGKLCEKYHLSFPQLALAWLLNQPQVCTLSAMTSERHLMENLAACNAVLETADVELLRKEYPFQQEFSPAVRLS